MDIESILESIRSWDHENIRDLREFLLELDEKMDDGRHSIYEYVDIGDLPSEEIPSDVDTGYPVWAMDKRGECLVGHDAFDHRVGRSNKTIEHIDEIRDVQSQRRK